MNKRTGITIYEPPTKLATTEPFYRFAAEYNDIIQLFFFIITTATRMDEMQNTARRALAKSLPDEYEANAPDTSYAFTRVRTYGYLLSRNLVTTMVNNFSSYLSEVIQAVVSKRSEVLRSSEKLSTEEILQFTRVADIVAYMADKKVNELSYGGLREIDRFIGERLGLQLFASDDERQLLTIFIELRNITTHNRGIVNDLFIKRVGTSKLQKFSFTLGKRHHVDFDEFMILAKNAMEVATRLDQQLAQKFKLPKRNLRKKLKTFIEARNKSMEKLAQPVPSET
jgi:hypothetical protein